MIFQCCYVTFFPDNKQRSDFYAMKMFTKSKAQIRLHPKRYGEISNFGWNEFSWDVTNFCKNKSLI